MAKKFNPFPDPKKGKGRKVLKRPASVKSLAWKKVPYVRGARTVKAHGVRKEQAHWKRTMTELLSCSDTQIVKTLIQDKLLPDWSGKVCPKCNKGSLSSLKVHCSEGVPKYRCSRKSCQQRVCPQYLHPLFQICRGPEGHSLQVQSAMLLLLLLRVSLASIHIILGVNHKAVENMQRRLEEVRRKYVEKKEKEIVFQKCKGWIDVEGDEVTFDKHDISQGPSLKHQVTGDKCLLWEQWCGLVQRENQKRSSLLA